MKPAPARHQGRLRDPFAPLVSLMESVCKTPLPPVLFIHGDDEWFVREGAKRIAAAFRKAFGEGETVEYDGLGNSVQEAINDVSTIALFATNRLVLLDGTEIFRGKKVTAAELDDILDQAKESGLLAQHGVHQDVRALGRLARKILALARSTGISAPDASDVASKLAGKVKRSDRASEIEALLGFGKEEAADGGFGLPSTVAYAAAGRPGENSILVYAVAPDHDHACFAALNRGGFAAGLVAADDVARRDRLAGLGVERAVERGIAIDTEVFELLTERGRLTARAFLSELDKLILSSEGKRVTAEAAARLITDERKEYGSDFVEAVAQRRFPEAIRLFERLLESENFTAFRPFGKDGKDGKDEGTAAKGPKGDASFFPLLGLMAAEFRRMLALKAVLEQGASPLASQRRVDYRTFSESVMPALKSPPSGMAPLAVDGHPFVIFKSYQALAAWPIGELAEVLTGLAAIDRAVKTGEGDGRELMENLLLSRVVKN